MIFKCYLCKNYKFWRKETCYEVVVTSNDGNNQLFSKKVCHSCGKQLDNNYFAGKQIADMKTMEED